MSAAQEYACCTAKLSASTLAAANAITGNQAQQAKQLMHLCPLQMLVKPAGKVLNYRTEVTGATDVTMQVSSSCFLSALQPLCCRVTGSC